VIKIDRLFQAEAPAGIDRPLEHLKACHRRIEDRLETLERVAEALSSHRDEALAALDKAVAFFDTNGVLHTRDEEESLFPRLWAAAGEDDRKVMADLEHDHRDADKLHEDLKAVAGELRAVETVTPDLANRYRQAATGLCSLYREHIRKEEATIGAIGPRLLSADDQHAIAREMKERRGLPLT
jgi:hemerythrin-like domain-containing protein